MSTSTTTSSLLNSVLQATTGSTSSGIDVTAAVNAVITAERAPETAWKAQQTAIANQTSAINQLQSESSTLADQLNALNDVVGVLSTVAVTSSNTGVVTASAQAGTAISNHVVVVNSLAVTGSSYSNTVASSSTSLGSGSFNLTVGSVTTTISIGGSGNPDTLTDLASSINSQSLGVRASVITDDTGSRLALIATSSGSAADFSISNASGLSFTHIPGADASLTVDGVPISSAGNTVTGVVQGLTLNLASASPGTEVNLALAPDTTNISNAIDNFVSAYNSLISDVNSQFSYNAGTGTAGTLSGDSIVRGLQTALLNAANYDPGSGSSVNSLASLGVSTNQDGTLSVDNSKLASTLSSNFSAVQSFFQGAAQSGFAATLNSALNTYTDPSEGAFTVDLSSLSTENQDLSSQISTFELYISAEQTRLTAEYSKADIALQQLPQEIRQTQTLLGQNTSSSNGG